MKIGETTLLELHLNRVLRSKMINELVVATTTAPEDNAVVEVAKRNNLKFYQGSVNDVLDRFYQSLQASNADYVVRITSDCPLIDAALIDKVIEHTVKNDLDYCSNTLDPHYPDGQDVEVFKYSSLVRAWNEAKLDSEREHVTPYLWKNSTYKGGSIFRSDNFSENYSYGHLRMTVDEKRDFDVITELVNHLGTERSWLDYATYLEKNADVKSINADFARNEGYSKSINKEK